MTLFQVLLVYFEVLSYLPLESHKSYIRQIYSIRCMSDKYYS
jgi:hypothetical protein